MGYASASHVHTYACYKYAYACMKHAHTHTHLETQTQNNKEPIINTRNQITYHAYNIKTKQPKLKTDILKQYNIKESKQTTQTRKYKV